MLAETERTAVVLETFVDKGADPHLLFLHTIDNGWWEFPGGSRDANRPTKTEAMRELLEETGISVSLSGTRGGEVIPHKVSRVTISTHSGDLLIKSSVYIVTLVTTQLPMVILNSGLTEQEHDASEWIKFDDVFSFDQKFSDVTVGILRRYLRRGTTAL